MINVHITLVHPSQDPQLQADMLQTITELIRNFPEGRIIQWYTPHLDEDVPTLDIVLNQRLSPVQETYLDEQFIITRYVVQETGTLLPTLLTENQVKVVTHLLKAAPLLIRDDAEIANSNYLLDSSVNGESLVANFAHWTEQHLVHTVLTEQGMQAQHLEIRDYLAMDRLCAAWIEFRCKYVQPKEEKQRDNDLSNIEKHAF